MNEPEPYLGRPVDPRVQLECGHRLPIPWDTAPAVAAAVLIHHRAGCAQDRPAAALPPAGGPRWLAQR